MDDLFFECDSFNSIIEYRNIGKILPKCILFLQNMILNKAIRSISYDNRQILLFKKKEFCCLWVLSPRIWNVLRMRFSKKYLMHQLKKWRDDQEISWKLSYLSVLFLGWKYPKSKHMGLSFKSHLKHLIFKVAVWLSGIALVL